jgi:hypothetical protein
MNGIFHFFNIFILNEFSINLDEIKIPAENQNALFLGLIYFVEILLSQNELVYLHCKAGIHRSSLFSICLLKCIHNVEIHRAELYVKYCFQKKKLFHFIRNKYNFLFDNQVNYMNDLFKKYNFLKNVNFDKNILYIIFVLNIYSHDKRNVSFKNITI